MQPASPEIKAYRLLCPYGHWNVTLKTCIDHKALSSILCVHCGTPMRAGLVGDNKKEATNEQQED